MINVFSGDSSCPFQVRSTTNPSKRELKRFPDAISIGIGKCGTGSIAFLDCHSKIRFRALEPNVFPNKYGSSDIYTDHKPFTFWPLEPVKNPIEDNHGGYLIPKATEDEFLIEKTPMYSQQIVSENDRGSSKRIAKDMKKLMPNVKLFMFVTDPVDRIYSHIKDSFNKFKITRKELGLKESNVGKWSLMLHCPFFLNQIEIFIQ